MSPKQTNMKRFTLFLPVLCCLLLASVSMAQTPAGNYGNIQLNRNGAFDTPGSDSATFINAGLQIKGNGLFTGNIGIGTTTPASKMQVIGNITLSKDGSTYTGRSITLQNGVNGLHGFVDISNGGLELGTTMNAGLIFNANSAPIGVWFPDGNLRIGTTNPAYGNNGNRFQVEGSANVDGNFGIGVAAPARKLHVNGDAQLDGALYLNDANGLDGHKWGIYGWDAGLHFTKRSSNWGYDLTAMIINYNGHVGIGVNPDANFHVAGQFKLVDGTQAAGKVLMSDANGLASWQTPSGSSNLWTDAGSGNIHNATLTGNVGIGTNAPQSKLHVEGNALVTGSAHIITGTTGSFKIGTYYNLHPIVYDGSTGIFDVYSFRSGPLYTPSWGGVQILGNIGHLVMVSDAQMTGYQQALKLTRVGFNGAGPTMEINDDGFYATNVGNAPAYKIISAKYNNTEVAYIGGAGNGHFAGSLTIGTTTLPAGYELAVKGEIIAEKVRVKLYAGWPDYVFNPGYDLPSLKETEQFIKTNNHLPGVPSAAEIEKDGLDLGDGQAVLLKKIEELTLYMIEINKTVEKLVAENEIMKKKLEKGRN